MNGSNFAKRSLGPASRPKTNQKIGESRVEHEVSARHEPNVCRMNVTARCETGEETRKEKNYTGSREIPNPRAHVVSNYDPSQKRERAAGKSRTDQPISRRHTHLEIVSSRAKNPIHAANQGGLYAQLLINAAGSEGRRKSRRIKISPKERHGYRTGFLGRVLNISVLLSFMDRSTAGGSDTSVSTNLGRPQ
jgi:hypothetical protein